MATTILYVVFNITIIIVAYSLAFVCIRIVYTYFTFNVTNSNYVESSSLLILHSAMKLVTF